MDKSRNISDIEKYMQFFVREAGHIALQSQTDLITVFQKDNQVLNASNIVTAADKQIGAFAEDFFPRIFNDAQVIQEETVDRFDPSKLNEETLTFVVDPIDGTLFYAKRNFAWTVSVGCFLGFTPIAGCIFAPVVKDIYYTLDGGSFWNGHQIQAIVPAGDQRAAILLRHIKAYHTIDSFPGYTMSIGSVALHLALVASGHACCCVTSRHRIYDVAGAIKILENAGAELSYLDGTAPSWRDLIMKPAERAPKHFIACARGYNAHFRQYLKENPSA
jgi:fructose-1,6-bisphosphatase/inositol monophosphatase family enzyme